MNISKATKKVFSGLNNFRHKFTKKRIILGSIILAILLGFMFFQGRNKVSDLTFDTVEKGNLSVGISSSGKIDAAKKANLNFQTAGKLTWIGVSVGSVVRPGQVIANLDKRELELQAKRLLNSFEREFTEFDDTNESVKDEVLTEEIKRLKKRAQIDLEQGVIDVEIQALALEYSRLVSPIGGIVVEMEPEVSGINITPASSHFLIVDPKSLIFVAEVNESDVSKIKLGQKVEIELDAFQGKIFNSEVQNISFISKQTSTGGTAYEVKITLKNIDSEIRLGMKGDANFVLQELSQVLLIDTAAVVEEVDGNYVWIVENGKLKKQKVELGESSLSETQIVSGLTEGQKVVVSPSVNLKEGQEVK